MSDYRRNYIKGGSYFFTVVTEKRRPILNNPLARKCLREAFSHCMKNHPLPLMQSSYYQIIFMQYGHCLMMMQIIQNDGESSKKTSLNPGLSKAARKLIFPSQNNAIIAAAYGNGDFGNIP